MGAERPLGSIADDAQYRAALATLDHLFGRDKRRTPGELAYFRWLARLARDYEVAAPRGGVRHPRRAHRRPSPWAGHGRAFATGPGA